MGWAMSDNGELIAGRAEPERREPRRIVAVTLDPAVLRLIDAVAHYTGENRSRTLERLALERLGLTGVKDDDCTRGLLQEARTRERALRERLRPARVNLHKRTLPPHGTPAAYSRHRRKGEPACGPCRASWAARRAGQRAGQTT